MSSATRNPAFNDTAGGGGDSPVPELHPHFFDMAQQSEAAGLGMWIFLVSEIMFFGGLFAAYTVYRWRFPQGFMDASRHLDLWLGSINTAVLICSSLTMALAVRAAQLGRRRALVWLLIFTMALGTLFLGIKFTEYGHKFEEGLAPGPLFTYPAAYARPAELFFVFYFTMTGIHALHMMIGIGVLGVLLAASWRGRFSPAYYNPIEMAGLYWHFVDIIWIFLFPLLYLIGLGGH